MKQIQKIIKHIIQKKDMINFPINKHNLTVFLIFEFVFLLLSAACEDLQQYLF